jgi:hypothetical protein
VKRRAGAAILILVLLGVFAVAAGCGSSSGPSGDAIATVGDTTVTKAQFDELIAQAKAQLKQQGSSFPNVGTPDYNRYAVPIVDYLVQNQIVTLSASQYGVTVTDAAVEDQIAQMQKAYGGLDQLRAALQKAGMSEALLRTTVKTRLLMQGVQAAVLKGTTITPGQIKGYWDAHKAELSTSKKTATFAKAKETIRSALLASTQQRLWSDWILRRQSELGVKYAPGYDPAKLPTPSAAASPN